MPSLTILYSIGDLPCIFIYSRVLIKTNRLRVLARKDKTGFSLTISRLLSTSSFKSSLDCESEFLAVFKKVNVCYNMVTLVSNSSSGTLVNSRKVKKVLLKA